MRSIATAVVLLLALGVAACEGEGPAGPADEDPADGGVRVYLCQEIMIVTGGPPVRYTHVVLLPDGTAIRRLPASGVDGVDVERLRARQPEDVGTWREEGGKLHLRWPDKAWTMTAENGGWRRDAPRLYEKAVAVHGSSLAGTYEADESTSVSIAGGVETVVSRTSRMTFHADGRFEASAAGGASHGDPAYEGGTPDLGGDAARASHGTYEIRGHTLLLRHEGGREERITLYRWPGTETAIGLDGRRYDPMK